MASDPFFLQGNLARVLMAGSELTKNNARYFEEGYVGAIVLSASNSEF